MIQVVSNWAGPVSDHPELRLRPLLSLNEGRVVLSYDAGYLRPPKRIAGKDPEYTLAGELEGVHGTIVAKCTITKQGRIKNCEAVQKLPRMNDATLDALETRVYEPARWNDQPFEATYWFRVNFR